MRPRLPLYFFFSKESRKEQVAPPYVSIFQIRADTPTMFTFRKGLAQLGDS